ncbi:MAG TPA: hypothetical protein VIW21_04065 [Chthoniobacterales bacterium]|jgi:hypothetical protein
MKPTLRISDQQTAAFPLSDYNFQPTLEDKSTSAAVAPATKSPAFHKLSSDVFSPALSASYLVELFCFVLIGGITAWPVIAALHAITRMVRNY